MNAVTSPSETAENPRLESGHAARGRKVVYLGAGAAGMYCGACLHDNTLAAAMLDMRVDMLLVPTYTPLRTDEPDVSQRRVMFGGINAYLQERVPLFRHTPRLLDGWLDSPRLLGWLARLPLSVEAAKLGRLTVSTLRGADGHQRKEVDKLIDWLASEVRPDLVHLSNIMLSGFAGEIRRRLGVPVVCSLAGEDIFLEKLLPPFRQQAHDQVRRNANDIAAFIALNRYYADFMADYAAIEPGRVHVVPHGLKLAGHAPRVPQAGAPPTIGFLARICEDKGLHQLVDAFELLARDEQLAGLRLRAAGYLGHGDRPYLRQLERRLADRGLAHRFEYLGEVSREEKIRFLHSLDVMSVPTVYRESKGLSILESLANAVPVVLPAHGAFPEMIEDTGGGLLSEPGSPADLANKLKRMLVEPELALSLGRSGHEAVHTRYHDRLMAERTLDVYRQVWDAAARAGHAPAGAGSRVP